jgi:hypothetical protein
LGKKFIYAVKWWHRLSDKKQQKICFKYFVDVTNGFISKQSFIEVWEKEKTKN